MKRFAPILFLSLAACIDESELPQPAAVPSHTLIVYMACDSDLAGEVAAKIEALRQGWHSAPERKCLIYADTPKYGARLLRLRGGCCYNPEPYVETIHEYGTENSASAETFGRVVREVAEQYPADSYGLIFFSHASGWLPQGTLQSPTRSLGRDGEECEEMELAAFAAAIPDRTFDYILFEGCLMAGVEVAYELRNKTEYILASPAEMLSPGFTPIYTSALVPLFDTSKPCAVRLEAFGNAYMNYINSRDGDDCSATLSLVETAEIETFTARLGEIVRPFSSSTKNPDITFGLQHFDRPGSYGDTPAVPRYFDFAEWLEYMIPEQYPVCEEQLKHIVTWRVCTNSFLLSQNGFFIRRFSGLTVYIPQPELPSLNSKYEQTAWCKALNLPAQ